MKLVALLLLLLSFLAGARGQAAGVACGTGGVCNAYLVCDIDTKCKKQVGYTCAAPTASANCVLNAECPGTGGATSICTCSGNYQADSNLCKAKGGVACNSAATPPIACVTGHTCSSTNGAGTCQADAGGACNTVATPAIACVPGYTCSNTTAAGTCQANAGSACNLVVTPPIACVTGRTCSSTTAAGTCSGAASVIASLALLTAAIVTTRFL